MFLKNVAGQKFILYAYTPADGLPATGAAAGITPYVGKDWGAATALGTATATEIDATNAPGYYTVAPTQGETNADALHVTAKHSTSTIKVLGAPAVIFPLPTTGVLSPATLGRTAVVDANGLIDSNLVKAGPSGSGVAVSAWSATRGLAGTALPNAAAEAAGGLYTRGTGAGQINQDGNGRVDSNATHFAGTAYATAAAALVAAVWDALTASFSTVGSIGKRIVDYLTGAVALDSTVAKAAALATAQASIDDLPTNAELATSQAAADDATLAQIALVKAQTDLLPSDPADASVVAGLIAALSAKVDAVDDLLDTELPALTTAVADLPTNAELATALAAADDAVLAAIAALNNLSAAQVNAEVVDALRTDTGTEVSSVPAAAAPISAQIQFLFQALRNKVLSGASLRIHNDAGTVIATKVQTDNGTTYTEEKAT